MFQGGGLYVVTNSTSPCSMSSVEIFFINELLLSACGEQPQTWQQPVILRIPMAPLGPTAQLDAA